MNSQPVSQQGIEFNILMVQEYFQQTDNEEDNLFDHSKYSRHSSRFPLQSAYRLMPKLCRHLVALHLKCPESFLDLKMLLFHLQQPSCLPTHQHLLKYTLLYTAVHDPRVHQFLLQDYSNIFADDTTALLPVQSLFFLYGNQTVRQSLKTQIQAMGTEEQTKVLRPLAEETLREIYLIRDPPSRKPLPDQDSFLTSLLKDKLQILSTGSLSQDQLLPIVKFISKFVLLPQHEAFVTPFYDSLDRLVKEQQKDPQVTVTLVQSMIDLISQSSGLDDCLLTKAFSSLHCLRLGPKESCLPRDIQLYKIIRLLERVESPEVSGICTQMLPKVMQSIGETSAVAKFIGLSAFEVLINHYEGDLEVFFLSDRVRQVFVDYLENQVDSA